MLSGLNCSTIASSEDIQLAARWQFANKTQPPRLQPLSMALWAFGPCPCPRDMDSKRFDIEFLSANASTSEIGSEPGERMKISGVMFVESAKLLAMSKVGGSTNFCPIFFATK